MQTPTNNQHILLPKEIEDIRKIMMIKHSGYLKDRNFRLSYEKENDKIFLKCILQNEDSSYFYPVESFTSLSDNELSPKDALLLLLDYVDIYFTEFFSNEEDVLIPIDWTEYTFEGSQIFLRGQIRNLYRENIADELLKSNEKISINLSNDMK